MGDRTFGRDGRAPAPRRTTDFDGRRRHDQQRLLVELELDDSLYQGTLQAGIEQHAPMYPVPGRRSTHAGDSRHLQHTDYMVEPRQRLPSRNPRDSTAKPLTEHQMQQLNAKRLSSPYKLKQEVLDTRNDSPPRRYQQEGSGTRRAIRSPTMQQSPAHLVMESIRQNMHLRDQVLAHLQQELMGVLPLHRASHVEKNVPQRVVKLLNRMRSLSLAVVEAVVYLSGELGDSNVVGQSVEHEVLEQDFFGYLLTMASDSDFLACSPQLQRFFEDFEVNLTRNPFVDGLSLDSSEVLLCSCHQSTDSGVLFCSASSSPSSLLRLLKQKLETFALQTQRYLPGWQILPAERVAAALLHLMDLETRFHAVRMIPRYLQSQIDSKRYLHQQRGPDCVTSSHGYGTFEDERIQRLDREDSQTSLSSDHGPRRGSSVVEAWAGSPIPKPSAVDASRQNTPDQQPPPVKTSSNTARSLSKKEEDTRRPSSAWIPVPSSPEPESTRSVTNTSSSARKAPADTDSAGDGVTVTRLILPSPVLDVSAAAKSSTRSNESERAASKRRSSKATDKLDHRRTLVESGTQMSERRTPPSLVVTPKEVPASEQSARTRATRDESMQVYQDESANLVSERRPSVRIVREDDWKTEACEVHPAAKSNEDELSESVATLELDASVGPTDLGQWSNAELDSSRDIIDEPSDVVDVVATTTADDDCGLEAHAKVVADLDDGYDCNFEYSSNEALSSIAMALQLLPNFTLSNTESTLDDDEVTKPEEAIPPNDYESALSSRTETNGADFTDSVAVPNVPSTPSVSVLPASTGRSTLNEVMENVITELESVEQRVEAPEPGDDEYAYSSSTAISNIAIALSLLPSSWKDNAFSAPDEQPEQQSETLMDINSSRPSTYRPLGDEHPSLDELRQPCLEESAVENIVSLSSRSIPAMEAEQASLFTPSSSRNIPTTFDEGAPESLLASARSNTSASFNQKALVPLPGTSRSSISAILNEKIMNSQPTSARSNISVALSDKVMNLPPSSSRSSASASTSYLADDESEPSEFNRIFALCRDIQVAAYGMSHWVSQREVEGEILSTAQPFSSLMGYSSPTTKPVATDSAPKYLERELKMLRRNFASWKVFCVEQKRARVVVRRLVARRKVRQFVSLHYSRRLQARIDAENRLRFLAASRIQRNWKIYRHNRELLQRKAVFRAIHMAFHRAIFYVNISKRRRVRECAKEKIVRWWRRQRLRIKRRKQQEEKRSREKERQSRALKDIRRFLKEILLRRKLKAAQEMAKNILFKEQLKWTKAKRDVQRSMKINSKHRRELIADMNARLADLDRRWKASEEERLQLLTHHERVVQQQQQAVEVRRRKLAALKLQMFFRVCTLHKKLRSVESEKNKYELQLRNELQAKEKIDVEAQKIIGKTRTQVRVLERKLGRMSQQALQTDAQHREVVRNHQERETLSQERAARQKIKAFVDARVLLRRAEHERRQLLTLQAHLQAEKTEIEFMSSEDQLEQRRAALSVASDLQQRLSELEARSQALLAAKSQLEAEKQQEAQRAAAALEQSRIEASMQQIAAWVSGQMQLSKLKKVHAAMRDSAAHELEEEKRRQRREIEAKTREVSSIKASSVMHQRVSQQRNHRTVEMLRIQQQQKAALEKSIAERTRAQLVQVVIAVKLLSETESSKGIGQGLNSVANFQKNTQRKCLRLKHLRSMNSARKIQRALRRWLHQQHIKRAEELALAQLLLAKRRQALARQIQAWWRQRIQQRRLEQQRVFEAHLEAIRVRANVRKIQGVWRRWMEVERERRIQQQSAFESHLEELRVRAAARKIQVAWRRWMEAERERRRQQQRVFEARLYSIRSRANARKIQAAWRRWIICERERRRRRQLAFQAHLEAIRVEARNRWVQHGQERRCQHQLALDELLQPIRERAYARKIQVTWRRWVVCQKERRHQQQLAFQAHLEAIRVRTYVRKIQSAWRHWIALEKERRREQQRVSQAHLQSIRVRANVRKIQGAWSRWVQCEHERRCEQQVAFEAHLEAIRARAYLRKIQAAWRRWVIHERQRRCEQQLVFQAHLEAIRVRANVRKIQGAWRRWVTCERARRQQQRLIFEAHLEAVRVRANVRKIQSAWRQWVTRERERREQQRLAFEAHLEAIRVRANVRKIRGVWRRWIQQERERRCQQEVAFLTHLSAIRARANVRKIQGAWRRWIRSELERRYQQQLAFNAHLGAIQLRASVHKIQGVWRRWVLSKQEQRDRIRLRLLVLSSAIRIQRRWRKWQKQQRAKAEQSRTRNASAQVIQRRWRSRRKWKEAEREQTRRRILRQACARKLQKAWKLWLQWRRRRERSARHIQKRWKKWQEEKREAGRVRNAQMLAAILIQQCWYRWHARRQLEREKARKLRMQQLSSAKIQAACCRWWKRKQEQRETLRSVLRIQRSWRKWRAQLQEKAERERQEKEERAVALKIQQNWTKKIFQRNQREEERRAKMEKAAMLLQRVWKKWHAVKCAQNELNRLRQEKQESLKAEQHELECDKQTRNASSLKIQRNWGIRQHRRKMERERIQHEQHMAALKIQTLWLRWHHEQKEELEREFIRQEQYESSVKNQRHWRISHHKRKLAEERLRHKQSLSALKIQKNWRRWHRLRLEQQERNQIEDPKAQMPPMEPSSDQQQREQRLEVIRNRSSGKCIARAVRKYLQSRREDSAATKIEAMWKAKLYRTHYLHELEAQRAEEVRVYRLAVSVLATKLQVCWRRWHAGVRQAKRAAVKNDELRLIQEAKALERKILVLKRTLAAKRIQRAIASRRRLQDIKFVAGAEVGKMTAGEEESTAKPPNDEPVDGQPQNEEPAGDYQEPVVEVPEEDLTRASVEKTVDTWSHRELPHIMTRSMNQIMFFHDVATVLQKCVRDYQRRKQLHFYFQRPTHDSKQDESDGDIPAGHFHFYFKRASAWLEWGGSKSTSYADSGLDTNQDTTLLRLRFDSQMTRRLLQLVEPTEEYTLSEIQQVLQEIAADAVPILQSPICGQDHENVRPDLRYHDVEEMELAGSVKLLRQKAQQRAHARRQQLLEIDTSFMEPPASPPSPVAKSVPISPIGKSAPSSPSQRAKKEVTIFTAVENASVEDATFLQQRGADLAAVESKMQRNALHLLSFSKENYRARAEMLEFLLSCDAKLDVDSVDCNGDTPLMLYASLGHLEFMQKLLEHGADIVKTNRKGQNVLHRACEDDQVEVCGFLQQLMMKDSIAENILPIETVSTLAPPALSLHTPDSVGRYPLHCLAEKGFVECAKQLVVPTEANYEWNRMLQAQGDSQGRTALHLAVLTHDTAMTSFLLTPGGGSNVDAFDDLHRSPLHYAVESPAALPIIARLVQHGAAVNVADERGDTPLHWAAFSGRAAVAQNLLTLGADPTLVNSDWETPAQIAAAYGQLDCMRLLLQAQRRYGAAASSPPKEGALIRPASEKTALQRLEEAVNHLHQRQASAHSQHAADLDAGIDTASNDLEGEGEATSQAEQSHAAYWEELHQDVQLVEESGHFSSEDEDDLLVGRDGDDDLNF